MNKFVCQNGCTLKIDKLEAQLEAVKSGIVTALYESDHLDDAKMHMREYHDINETDKVARLQAQLEAVKVLPDKWRKDFLNEAVDFRYPAYVDPPADICADQLEAALQEKRNES